MSEADEILNSLNYKFVKEDDNFITYERVDFGTYSYTLTFNKEVKSVIKYHEIYDDRLFLTMDELKAINLKCRELGWIGGEDE